MNEMIFLTMLLFTMCLNLWAFHKGVEWLIALIAVEIVLMNIFAIKQMNLFGLAVTGGNVMYAAIFLSTDLISEFFGKKQALQAVKIGFFATIFATLVFQFILRFQPSDFDFAQSHFIELFNFLPRIVVGSLVAYWIAQNLDVHLFHKIKNKTGNKHLWLRNTGSTAISQLLDSIIFTTVGLLIIPGLPDNVYFAGVISPEIFWEVVLFTYLIKLLAAILDTPFIYLAKNWQKKYKNSSLVFETSTRFNKC